MLVLGRKLNQRILIDGGITITVVDIRDNLVRLGIDAPREIRVDREERRLKREAAGTSPAAEP